MMTNDPRWIPKGVPYTVYIPTGVDGVTSANPPQYYYDSNYNNRGNKNGAQPPLQQPYNMFQNTQAYTDEYLRNSSNVAGDAVYAIAIANMWQSHKDRVAERAHLPWTGRHPYFFIWLATFQLLFPPYQTRPRNLWAVIRNSERRVVLWYAAQWVYVTYFWLYPWTKHFLGWIL